MIIKMHGTLQQLGQEYLCQCKKISAKIRMLKAQLKTAPPDELRSLEQRIAVLYEEHGRLKKTGGYLVNYYQRVR
ncbi:MAG: hypothetical protein ACERKO_03145 [Acetanaerobacterium sp.]